MENWGKVTDQLERGGRPRLHTVGQLHAGPPFGGRVISKVYLGVEFYGLKNPLFYADFKMGHFTFVTSSYQKIEPKKSIF
jgi:hypothetical protein